MQEDLDKFIASKALVTKQQRKLERYIAQEKSNNMFFDESSDEEIINIKAKIERNKLMVSQAEERLKKKVEQFKNHHLLEN